MKRKLFSLGVLLLTFGFAGCVVNVGSRHAGPTPPPSSLPPPPPVAPGDAAQAATLAEIDAAARLGFDASRVRALSQIAERPVLSPTAQVHLVNVAYRCLSFESSKTQLLHKVIAHPAFCDSTRHAIVSQLNHLTFDSSKESILREINARLAPH